MINLLTVFSTTFRKAFTTVGHKILNHKLDYQGLSSVTKTEPIMRLLIV